MGTTNDNNKDTTLREGQYMDPFLSISDYKQRNMLLQQIQGEKEPKVEIQGLELLEEELQAGCNGLSSDSSDSFANDSLEMKHSRQVPRVSTQRKQRSRQCRRASTGGAQAAVVLKEREVPIGTNSKNLKAPVAQRRFSNQAA